MKGVVMEDETHLQPSAESEDGASVNALTSDQPLDSPRPDVKDAARTRAGGSPPGAQGGTTAKALPVILRPASSQQASGTASPRSGSGGAEQGRPQSGAGHDRRGHAQSFRVRAPPNENR